MSFEVGYDESDNVVEVKLHGDVTFQEVLNFIDEMIKLTQKFSCYEWIVNYEDARYKLNTWEIYDLPKMVIEKMEVLGERKYQVKRAIIRINDKADFSFLENVAANNCQSLRVFDNKQAALNRLKVRNTDIV